MPKKSKLATFLLSVIPGLPQIYLGHAGRGLLILGLTALYTMGVFFLALVTGGRGVLLLLLAIPLIWLIGLVDAFVLLSRSNAEPFVASTEDTENTMPGKERELLVLAALIPGGGQMYLGETDRGLPLLVGFFGWLTFSSYLAVNFAGGFIVLWGLLPVIWAYSFFDALQGWQCKSAVANNMRPSLAQELEQAFTDGGRSSAWAGILSLIPGLGHMYLGQLDKGLGIMAGFLLIVLLNNFLRFNFAFVAVPLLWFYSVFDTLAQLPMLKEGKSSTATTETPAAGRWLGYALVGGGVLLLVERLLIPFMDPQLIQYLQPLVLALVLIIVGVRLLFGAQVPEKTAPDKATEDGEEK